MRWLLRLIEFDEVSRRISHECLVASPFGSQARLADGHAPRLDRRDSGIQIVNLYRKMLAIGGYVVVLDADV